MPTLPDALWLSSSFALTQAELQKLLDEERAARSGDADSMAAKLAAAKARIKELEAALEELRALKEALDAAKAKLVSEQALGAVSATLSMPGEPQGLQRRNTLSVRFPLTLLP